MIPVGSIVKLAADLYTSSSRMIVIDSKTTCDGTGGDGAGLLCWWLLDGVPQTAWLSESSVVNESPGWVVDIKDLSI